MQSFEEKEKMENYKKKKYAFFSIISLFVAYLFYLTPVIYDDRVNQAKSSLYNSFYKDWHEVFSMYFSWSSRTIVNFFMYQFEVHNKLIFAIVTGAFFFLMLFSISLIVNKNENLKLDISIAFALMIIPFSYYSTAGWIATTATYLFPICAATFVVTPIFRENTTKRKFEKVLLCLATLYAANNEQVLIVLLCIFCTYTITKFIKKSVISKLIISQDVLLLFSLLWFVMSPGNKERSLEEIPRWFPQFKEMNFFNKMDMGFMTTVQHILFGNLPYMLLIVTIPVIFYIKQVKKDRLLKPYVITSFLTLIIWGTYSILFDIFNITHSEGLSKLFVFPKEGLFTPDTIYSKRCLLSFIVYVIFIALLLFNYSYKMKLDNYFILLASFFGALLSRVALGFSATNYVSATRTFSVMATVLVIMVLFMLRKIVESRKYKYINMLIISMAVINVFVMYWQITNGNLRLVPLWISILGS